MVLEVQIQALSCTSSRLFPLVVKWSSNRWSLFSLPKHENFAGRAIYEGSNGTTLLESLRKLNIQDQPLQLLANRTNPLRSLIILTVVILVLILAVILAVIPLSLP